MRIWLAKTIVAIKVVHATRTDICSGFQRFTLQLFYATWPRTVTFVNIDAGLPGRDLNQGPLPKKVSVDAIIMSSASIVQNKY